ncbi:MAG: ROK family protein [Bacteriovoracaceae bacterium]|nr:ROK family protein [Bacteriovoracaceae bacterium]
MNQRIQSYVIGIDIGGTKTECCVFELSNESTPDTFFVPHKRFSSIKKVCGMRIPTDEAAGYDTFLEGVSNLVVSLLNDSSIHSDSLLGIGIGMPGTICPKTLVMLNGNTKMFVGNAFGSDLISALPFSCDFGVYNDANCFAIAEAYSGAGHLHSKHTSTPELELSSVGVILGTGVGGGIVLGGKCLTGPHGSAGEIGHTSLVTGGVDCYCGRKGCAESYLSGTGIQRIFKERYGYSKESVNIFSGAIAGDVDCLNVITQYREDLARFFANLVNILDVDFIVCGGGVSNQDIIYEGLEEMVGSLSFVDKKSFKIYKHQISDSAGVMGAAMQVCNQ